MKLCIAKPAALRGFSFPFNIAPWSTAHVSGEQVGMRFFVVCATILLCAMSAAAAEDASNTTNTLSEWVTFNPITAPWEDCKGKCALTFFAGPQLRTGEGQVLGVNGFVPPWRYQFGDSGLVGGALSETLVEFKNYADIEAEIGVGQRFGDMRQTEGWVALYGRWKWFPWNKFITTTVAVSTGINYASSISPYEVSVSSVGHGSNFLHYFSPEITFADPRRPDWQFLIRLHHRSGGGQYWGYTSLFKGVGGGAQYLVFGIRHWY